jgi:hypothetical protein
MKPRFAEVAILEVLLNRLVKLGLISEQDRYEIYVEASTAANAAVLSDPKVSVDLLMLADGDDDND